MSLCVVRERATNLNVGRRLYGSLEEARRAFPARDRFMVVLTEQSCEATEYCNADATTTAVDPAIRNSDPTVPICGRCRGVDEHGALLEVVTPDV